MERGGSEDREGQRVLEGPWPYKRSSLALDTFHTYFLGTAFVPGAMLPVGNSSGLKELSPAPGDHCGFANKLSGASLGLYVHLLA